MKAGKIKPKVGVELGMIKIGGRMMMPPQVGVEEGTSVAVGGSVEVKLGGTGVGGAAMIARVSGIQVAVVMLPAIQP